MKSTNYPGIDYSGPGSQANRDSGTGIRYGIISQHDVMPEAINDIISNGTDLGFENAVEEFKSRLRGALSDYFSDYGEKPTRLDRAVDSAFDACDGWADNVETHGPWQYERDGYSLQVDSGDGATTDLWVFKSPFFTYAQFCSPCAPGACHLGNPLTEPVEANRCYCLGADWFEDGKAPYPIYSVETGKLI